MGKSPKNQKGGSGLGTIITLVIVGYGIFVGLQYVPQLIESTTVDGILESIEGSHKVERATSIDAVNAMIDKQLNINEMRSLKDNFDVTQDRNTYTIKVSYERELDLLFEKKKVKYQKTMTLY